MAAGWQNLCEHMWTEACFLILFAIIFISSADVPAQLRICLFLQGLFVFFRIFGSHNFL